MIRLPASQFVTQSEVSHTWSTGAACELMSDQVLRRQTSRLCGCRLMTDRVCLPAQVNLFLEWAGLSALTSHFSAETRVRGVLLRLVCALFLGGGSEHGSKNAISSSDFFFSLFLFFFVKFCSNVCCFRKARNWEPGLGGAPSGLDKNRSKV